MNSRNLFCLLVVAIANVFIFVYFPRFLSSYIRFMQVCLLSLIHSFFLRNEFRLRKSHNDSLTVVFIVMHDS